MIVWAIARLSSAAIQTMDRVALSSGSKALRSFQTRFSALTPSCQGWASSHCDPAYVHRSTPNCQGSRPTSVCCGTPMSVAEVFVPSCKACGKRQSPHQRRSSRPGKRPCVCVWPLSQGGRKESLRTQRHGRIGRMHCACDRRLLAVGKRPNLYEQDFPRIGRTQYDCGRLCSVIGKKAHPFGRGCLHLGKRQYDCGPLCSAIGKKAGGCAPHTSPAGATVFQPDRVSGRTGKKRASRLLVCPCGHQSRPRSSCLAMTRPQSGGSYFLTSPWATVASYSSASGPVKSCRLQRSSFNPRGTTSW